MNITAILSLIVFILYVEMGLYVLWRNPRANINKWFFYSTIFFALWALGHVYHDPSHLKYDGYVLFSIAVIGAALYQPFIIRFISLLTDYPKSNVAKLWLFRVFLFFGLALAVNILFIDKYSERRLFLESVINPGEHLNYAIYYFAYVTLSLVALFYMLLMHRKGMTSQGEKVQFRLLFFSLLTSSVLGFLFDLILPLAGITDWFYLSQVFSVIWLGGITYGVIRSHMFALTPELAAEQVVNQSRQIMFFCNLWGNVSKTNAFTKDLMQLNEQSILGKKVSSLFVDESEVKKYFEWAQNNGYSGPVELNLKSDSGEYIPVNASFTMAKDSYNDFLGLMVFGQDFREDIKLRNEILIRKQIENKLRGMSDVLEARVKERSDQLSKSFKELQVKMTERLKVEERIKSDIAEKEVLINEIHNRVKSNMNLIIALINSQLLPGNAQKVNQKFRELAQRVKAILLIHQHLYLSIKYSEVDFSGFLKDLIMQLKELYEIEEQIEIDLNVSEIFLDIDQAIPLGIIANEIISNAFSHAFKPQSKKNTPGSQKILTINFYQENGSGYLEVADNGKGLPKNFKTLTQKTSGIVLVEILVNDQVNGSLSIESKQGTSVKIIFPLATKLNTDN